MTKQDVYMSVALAVAEMATCPIRKVGCVAVDARGRIISTGHNGVPVGHIHCTDSFCGDSPCLAVHAEANAIINCPDAQAIKDIHVTLAPCIECAKLIANTGCKRVFYMEEHKPHGIELLKRLNIVCVKV